MLADRQFITFLCKTIREKYLSPAFPYLPTYLPTYPYLTTYCHHRNLNPFCWLNRRTNPPPQFYFGCWGRCPESTGSFLFDHGLTQLTPDVVKAPLYRLSISLKVIVVGWRVASEIRAVTWPWMLFSILCFNYFFFFTGETKIIPNRNKIWIYILCKFLF